MAPKAKAPVSKVALPHDDEPEVDEATGLRLMKRLNLRISLEADLKEFITPPPKENEEPPPPEPVVGKKPKSPATKGKPKGAAAPAAKASSEPGVPQRTLALSWTNPSGRVLKWAPWDSEPTTEGAPPLEVEIDGEAAGCNPSEPLAEEVQSTYQGGVKAGGSFRLSFNQQMKSNTALINTLVAEGANLEVQLKQTTGALPEVTEEQEASGALQLDVADLLLQEKYVEQEWHEDGDSAKGAQLPEALRKEFSRVRIRMELWSIEVPAVTEGDEPKDAVPAAPCSLMTHDLACVLNPLVIRPLQVWSLPDMPATRDQIDKGCYPMTLKYSFPLPDPGQRMVHHGNPSPWRVPPEEDLLDEPSLRDCHFTSRDIFLLGDMDMDTLEQFCKESQLEVQVHDRDAKPEEPEFVLKNVPPEFRKPPFWYPGKNDDQPPPPEASEEGEEAAAPAVTIDDDDDGEVFGSIKVGLSDFIKGYTSIDVNLPVQPATTIRGAAGLEWNTRPGRYLQADSELSMSLRVAVPIKDMTGKEFRPKVFNRIVFLMDYKDVELFLRIEKAVKAINIVTLDLLPEPSEEEGMGPEQEASKAESEATDEIAALQREVDGEPEVDEGPKYPPPPAPPPDFPHTHLQELEVSLFVQQQLSTYRLSDEERVDPELDVLTGCHIIDSKWRMIILEGRQHGALQLMAMIASWAMRNRNAVKGGRPRQVVYNFHLRYPHRLFCSLGVNLWIIKIRVPLPKLVADPASWAQGMVREQCKEGIRRLLMLTQATFMRQVDEHNWMPTDAQLTFVDKKFGGELTREDVLGFSRKSKRKQRVSGMSKMLHAVHSVSSSQMSRDETQQRTRYKALLDMDNSAYVQAKQEHAERRATIDWKQAHKAEMSELEDAKTDLREHWATWNPQRAAAKELVTLVLTGELSLEECEAARVTRGKELIPGTIPRGEAVNMGWYPHDKPFLWPSPKDPAVFNAHSKKPSGARIQELGYPWVEGEMFKPVGTRPINDGGAVFQTIFGGEDKILFGKDPEYWKTVFIGGDGLEKEMLADKQKEQEDWEKKVVVDDIYFRSVIHARNAGQLDRTGLILRDRPKKKSLKKTHIRQMPISLFLDEDQIEGEQQTVLGTHKDLPEKWMDSTGRDFTRHIARNKTKVYYPGQSQAWGH